MDKFELKRYFLPIFQEIQTKMINLSEQKHLICSIEVWHDQLEIAIRQWYTLGNDTKSISKYVTLYDFFTLEENLERFNEFKNEVKYSLGLVL